MLGRFRRSMGMLISVVFNMLGVKGTNAHMVGLSR